MRIRTFGRLTVLTLVSATLITSFAHAAVTNDRLYQMGEGAAGTGGSVPENGVAGQVVGSGVANALAGDTVDNVGPSGAFLGLNQTGSPVYANVNSGTFARPGTSAGDTGILFDGVNDHLQGIPLNRPDELAGPTPLGQGPLVANYPHNYDNITTRGLQGWVYPDAAALGSEGAPTTFQSIVFDTIFSGGPAITADGKWTQISSFHGDGASGVGAVPATVDVPAGDTWYHVMHHNYDANGPSGASVIPGTGAARPFISVLYVDGVAVSANNDNINTGGNADFNGLLVVGAAEIDLDFTGTIDGIGNYYTGVIDDLSMYVSGDNTADGGQDYGTFNLFADNEWIAAEILATVPGGVLTPGDVNKDGTVSGDGTGAVGSDDVSAFIAGWRSENAIEGVHNITRVGDWNSWDNGDLNHDGVTNFLDWDLLRFNHPAPLSLELGALLTAAAVPEPSSTALLLLGVASSGLLSRRRRA